MASTEKYATGDGVRYSVRYRTPSGSQTKKRGFKTKRDAEMFLATTEVRKASGDYVAPKLGRLTVGELGAEWLERKRSTIKQITYVNYEHIWRRQVLPAWGSVPVAAVDVLGVEAWVAELLKDNGAGTVRKAASILGMVARRRGEGQADLGQSGEGHRQFPGRGSEAPRLPDRCGRGSAGHRGGR